MIADALIVARGGMLLPHEAQPEGVPPSYDWHSRPVIRPARSDMQALTGWVQAFRRGAVPVVLQIAGMQTWLRSGSAWRQVQSGRLEGAIFAPDFATNNNAPPLRLLQVDGVCTVEWAAGAWHCWPSRRAAWSPADEIAVACQVRCAVGSALVGCGADYWRTLSAPYGDGTNNPGIGIGRLRVVGLDWVWVGMSSAP